MAAVETVDIAVAAVIAGTMLVMAVAVTVAAAVIAAGHRPDALPHPTTDVPDEITVRDRDLIHHVSV